MDRLDGGAGSDTADYSGEASAITVDLSQATETSGPDMGYNLLGAAAGGAAGDKLKGIENIIGTAGDDTLTGGTGANTFTGGDGADALDGGAGTGDDLDTADYSNYDLATDSVTVTLAGSTAAPAVVRRDGESTDDPGNNDSLENVENIVGTAGDDVLTGDTAANTFTGGGGADTLDGGAGMEKADYSDD